VSDLVELLPRVRREEWVERRREIHVWGEKSSGEDTIFWKPDAITTPREDAAIKAAQRPWVDDKRSMDWGIAITCELLENWGWRLDETWTDERGEMHARLSRPE